MVWGLGLEGWLVRSLPRRATREKPHAHENDGRCLSYARGGREGAFHGQSVTLFSRALPVGCAHCTTQVPDRTGDSLLRSGGAVVEHPPRERRVRHSRPYIPLRGMSVEFFSAIATPEGHY